MTNSTQRGFIALMSAIIISIMLLTIALTTSMNGISSRFNVFDSESKERGVALAEACVDTAILKLSNNIDYLVVSADHNITVTGSDTCNIVSISPTPPRTGNTTINTQAIINKAYTNLVVVIDANYNLISWEETP